MYVGVNGLARSVKKAYIGVNGVAQLFFSSGKPLSELAEGTIIHVQENGAPNEFCVAKIGYEPNLNLPGIVLLMRKDLYDKRLWHGSNVYNYASSAIDSWCVNTYFMVLSSAVQKLLVSTNVPYTPVNGGTTVSRLNRKIFLPSVAEISSNVPSDYNTEGTTFPISEEFKIAYFEGTASTYWTRSINTDSDRVGIINTVGSPVLSAASSSKWGSRPCFCFPGQVLIDDDLNLVEEQEPPTSAAELGELAEGSVITITENGSPVEFYVAKQNYEPELNGEGRVLVVRKDIISDEVWDSGGVNAFSGSDIDYLLCGTYKNRLSSAVQKMIGTTKMQYTPGNADEALSTLDRSVFILSLTELGRNSSYANKEGSALPIFETLWIANFNGVRTSQWTRSPEKGYRDQVWYIDSVGNPYDAEPFRTRGARPCFTLPSTAKVNYQMALVEK